MIGREYGTAHVWQTDAFTATLQWALGGTVAVTPMFTRTDLGKVA